ncbi:MAG: hypothetical protein E6K60_09150 [Nitrospirae bacterium]|nr:MAG: hypothetical protein E6K60_09150 [Nitrospirota bacterium]
MESSQAFLDRAFVTLQRSDPIPKLLPQVRLGRMPKDSPALAAIISSWLDAFVNVLKDGRSVLDREGVVRLDPNPRIAVLVEAGILDENHAPVQAVRQAWAAARDAAETRSAAR